MRSVSLPISGPVTPSASAAAAKAPPITAPPAP